jgi:hypothetical protein
VKKVRGMTFQTPKTIIRQSHTSTLFPKKSNTSTACNPFH